MNLHVNTHHIRVDPFHKEVIEFWSNTLKNCYNENEKVPIKYLIGHRGQAPPNIIMGNVDSTTIKLRNFLVRFPEYFVVTEDTVMLKKIEAIEMKSLTELKRGEVDSKMNQQTESQQVNLHHINTDPVLKEALEFWSNTLNKYYNKSEKVPIWYLMIHREQASPNIRYRFDFTEEKLRNFLARFPEYFEVTEDTVMLKKIEAIETKSLTELKRSEVDSKMNQQTESQQVNLYHIHDPVLKEAVEFWFNTLNKYYNKSEKVPIRYLMRHKEQASPNIRFDFTEEKLRNFLARFPEYFEVTEDTVMLKNFTIETKSFYELKREEVDSKMKDKDRLNFFLNFLKKRPQTVNRVYDEIQPYILQHPWYPLFKTPEDVSFFLKLYPTFFRFQYNLVGLSHEYINSLKQLAVEWTSQVLQKTQFINNVSDCARLVNRLMNTYYIAFDSEWTETRITLLQIADSHGRTYIIDLLACSDMILIGGIDKLLSSNAVMKIMHDCRQDKINFKNQFGIIIRRVFDTQIAYSVLLHQTTGKPFNRGPVIGLNALYKLYGAPTNPFKEDMKRRYILYPGLWAMRPLSRDMAAYAASDVQSLPSVFLAILNDLNLYSEKLVWKLSKRRGISNDTYLDDCDESDTDTDTDTVENQSSLFNSILFWVLLAVAVIIGVTKLKS